MNPPSFEYRALDDGGRIVRGCKQAVDRPSLRSQLDAEGLTLLRCRRRRLQVLTQGRAKVSRKQRIGLTLQLEQLLKAGIPPIEALHALADSLSPGVLREVITQLATDVNGGATLSQACARHPQIFGPIYVPMLRVGEHAGEVPQVLARLAALLSWQEQMLRKTRSLLLYPLLVAAVLILVLAIMLGFLVPELDAFLATTGEAIPAHTRALLFASQLWLDWWPLLPLLGVLTVLGLVLPIRLSAGASHRIDAWKLRAWPFGPLLLRVQLARFANGFALTYAAGINVLDALTLCRDIVDNQALRRALQTAQEQVAKGETISASFARTGLFPKLVVRMLAVGESSGELDKALLNVQHFYERDVEAAIQRIEPLFAPVMILVMGVFVLWIVLAVLGPIYDAVLTLGIAA